MNLKPALIIATIILTTYACTKKEVEDLTSPIFGTAVTFSAQTSNSMTISWAATDDETPSADISYKVVYSLSDNISTLADAEANGTILQDWTINSLTANMTTLTAVTTYYVSVLARDMDSNTRISSGSSSTLCGGKIMFLATVPNGSFGGASSADTACNAQKPTGFSSSTFKAMLSDGTSRRACYSSGNDNCSMIGTAGRVNWVLGASQSYCTTDYTVQIGTTDTNAFLIVPYENTLASSTTAVYTGLNSFWGSSASNCGGFASVSGTGILGSANGTENGSTQHTFISNGTGGCAGVGSIYCVEQ